MIDVTIEQVSPEVGSATLHGWNTCRLVKTGGALWFVANKPSPADDDGSDWLVQRTLMYRRELSADCKWELAADIDPRHLGYEAGGGPGGLRDSRGQEIGSKPRSTDFVIWWDGDLIREFVTSSGINKWNWETGAEERLFSMEGARRRRPNLTGDLIGDWREELLTTAPDGQSLRLYTTTTPTEHRVYTLMHDPQYRLGIAWQNVVYNKPPHPSFFLGHGMKPPPRPNIRLIGNGEAIMPTAEQNR